MKVTKIQVCDKEIFTQYSPFDLLPEINSGSFMNVKDIVSNIEYYINPSSISYISDAYIEIEDEVVESNIVNRKVFVGTSNKMAQYELESHRKNPTYSYYRPYKSIKIYANKSAKKEVH